MAKMNLISSQSHAFILDIHEHKINCMAGLLQSQYPSHVHVAVFKSTKKTSVEMLSIELYLYTI